MRLIDADLLRKQFRKRELERNGRYMNGAMIFNVRKIIDEAPTVEQPHGVWKEVCDFDGKHYKWECSVCGRLEEFEEDFCNCGADMRKESEEK